MNNCRVLLADDEAAILEGYKLLFDWEKYQCEIAGTAMDCLLYTSALKQLKHECWSLQYRIEKARLSWGLKRLATTGLHWLHG